MNCIQGLRNWTNPAVSGIVMVIDFLNQLGAETKSIL